ncbi:hypothetical protein EZJ49_00435 [Bdellovibrio bacteriovorus]|uniref:hypothetical protein n=1 Tax=Bdellovibrio bacteriovorus TaxID=959 RepID=UPI0021D1233E|nr:hypothetical protein [Bdellovibrio bacteriovorus]UXR64721.1 hypothetical protein EZJ49_00435 [Bdellovibrio bacteriovorus]
MEMELALNSLTATYRSNLEELGCLLKTLGHEVRPYTHTHLPHFHQLSTSKQSAVSAALEAYIGALKAECQLGGDFNHERFVLQFLFRMGIVPSEDLNDTIHREKYIQIYNSDQLQIFRSLSCYDRCSFTLEQLTTHPWFDLWERDSLFYYALFGLASTALKVVKFTKLRLNFPFHRVTEMNSANNFSFDYRIKSLSALTRQGKLQAALLIEDWKF